MSKFNQHGTRAAVSSPVTTEQAPSGRTFEGAPGYVRDAKSELFLLAVANMVGESTFYETASDRDERYRNLVRQVALEDPVWLHNMLIWLREDANMRSAPVVGACEMVKARLEAKADPLFLGPDMRNVDRLVIDSVCKRADEPGELLAYWTSKYGRTIPKPVKRGVADACQRLFNEYAVAKYDSGAFRIGDVIDLVHPTPDPAKPWQGDLFEHALDRRHGRAEEIPESLSTIRWRADLMARPVAERRRILLDAPGRLSMAEMTWEAVAGWLQGPMDAAAWSAVIPSMGIFALVRNLRNFDQAGVSDAVAEQVAAKISDPEQVARSRMFPFRFWAAYKHTASLRWGHALEKALTASLANVPTLSGRTLVLVDRSPSMFPGYYCSTPNKGDIPLAEQAAVFGAAVALRAQDATLVEFGAESRRVTVPKAGSVLRLVEAFTQINGTDIPSAVRQHYAGHDRVIVVTDEQTRPGYLPSNMWGHGGMRETGIDELIPTQVPVYMWNMAGYRPGAMPSGVGNRHAFGGLSDAAFRMIPLLEAGRSASWPWMSKPAA